MKNNTSLGALLTMLAMLCFASMDAISKSLVADYPVGQMMWIRYFLLCLFFAYIYPIAIWTRKLERKYHVGS